MSRQRLFPVNCARCGHHIRKHGGYRSQPGASCAVYTGPAGARHPCPCEKFVQADTPETVAEKMKKAREVMEQFARICGVKP